MMREQACIVARYRFRVAGEPGILARPAGEQRSVRMADSAAVGAAIELRGYPADEILRHVGQLG
jgi:hypothetical protein